MSEITKNEEILMLAVWRLRGDAYGVSIKQHVNEVTGRDWNYGTLYCTLDQLAKKGLLVKRVGKPMSTRGGRRKIYYQISRAGIKILQAACEMQRSLWEGVTPASLAKGWVR